VPLLTKHNEHILNTLWDSVRHAEVPALPVAIRLFPKKTLKFFIGSLKYGCSFCLLLEFY